MFGDGTKSLGEQNMEGRKPEHYIYALLVFVAASENDEVIEGEATREVGTIGRRIGN